MQGEWRLGVQLWAGAPFRGSRGLRHREDPTPELVGALGTAEQGYGVPTDPRQLSPALMHEAQTPQGQQNRAGSPQPLTAPDRWSRKLCDSGVSSPRPPVSPSSICLPETASCLPLPLLFSMSQRGSQEKNQVTRPNSQQGPGDKHSLPGSQVSGTPHFPAATNHSTSLNPK